MEKWTAALLLMAGLSLAQAPDPAAPDLAEEELAREDASRWATGLTDRFARYSNSVVSAHALARLAELVCQVQPVSGAQIFRQAIVRIDGLKVADFSDEKSPLLPVASFTRLWRTTEANAIKCDANLASAYRKDSFEERVGLERGEGPARINQAKTVMDTEPERADRAAQLIEGALDVAFFAQEPAMLDFKALGKQLSMVRERAPEAADHVFRYALEVVSTAPSPRTELFDELGKYLFVPTGMRERPDTDYAYTNLSVGTTSVADFSAIRYSTNPDLITDYIDALLRMSQTAGYNYDANVAYTIAAQLLPKARDLELNRALDLERLMGTLSVLTGGQATAAMASSVNMEAGDAAARSERAIRTALQRALQGKTDEMRMLITAVASLDVRQQLRDIATYADARAAIAAKDWSRAPGFANLMPLGVKRALLYTGMMASGPRELAIQEVGLQVRDANALPAEFKIALLCAASEAMMESDLEQSLSLLNQAVGAANAAQSRPREARFDPARRRTGSSKGAAADTDVPLMALGESTIYEAVDGRVGRHYFQLDVPGVGAYSLPAAFAAQGSTDYRRLEAVALGIREERTQAAALLAIAAPRLEPANNPEVKNRQ